MLRDNVESLVDDQNATLGYSPLVTGSGVDLSGARKQKTFPSKINITDE